MRRWLPHLVIFTTLYFAALAVFSTLWLSAAGMGAFDGQFLGYTFEARQMYLDDLTPAQVALYRGPFRIADTVFPALVALCLLVWFRDRTNGAARLGLMVMTAVYLAADYTENMLVARLIGLGADGITARGVQVASTFTQVKWASLMICLIAAGVLWVRARRAGPV